MKILILAALALAGATVAGVVAHASASTKTIRVTEREFKIGLSTTHAGAGTVRFDVENTGTIAHALAISGAGVKAKTPLIKPGKTAVLTVTLKSGRYSIWCPVPGHAARGMKATVLVPVSKSGSAGSGNTNTSTDSGAAWG